MARTLSDRLLHELHRMGLSFFMEIFEFAAWELWNLRNSKIFDNGTPTLHIWLKKFRYQVYLQLVRVREDKRLSIILWLEAIT